MSLENFFSIRYLNKDWVIFYTNGNVEIGDRIITKNGGYFNLTVSRED